MALQTISHDNSELSRLAFSNSESGISSLSPQQGNQFPVSLDGNNVQNYEVYAYLSRECSGGWFPSFTHCQAAARSISHCLLSVSDDRYAALNTVSLPNAQHYMQHTDLQLGTLREEVENCRVLFTKTLSSLAIEMDDICAKSEMLSANSGPLVRALNHCVQGKPICAPSLHYLESTEETCAEMLSIFNTITDRWGKLHKKVHRLDSILSKQLSHIQEVQSETENNIAKNNNTLASLCERIDTVRAEGREINLRLKQFTKLQKAAKVDVQQATAKGDDLADQLEARRVELRHLEDDLEKKPKHFAEAQRREEIRIEKASQTAGWGAWILDAMFNLSGNLDDLRQTTAWDTTVQEYRNWEAETNIKVLKLQEEIVSLEHEVEKHQRTTQQKSRNHVLSLQNDDSLQNKLTSELVSLSNRVKAMEDEKKSLQNSIVNDQEVLSTLKSFREATPNLCRNIKEAETNINHSYIAYKHICNKLIACARTTAQVSQQMQKKKKSSEERNDILEDITFLRITFLVVSDMANRSSIVSRELFSRGLSIMAPLSIQSSPHNTQIEKLSQAGDEAAMQYDQAQTQRKTFNRLCRRVEDIVKSTQFTMSNSTSKPAAESTSLDTLREDTLGQPRFEPKSKNGINWKSVFKRKS